MFESITREFKRKWRDDYLEHICGMANAEGGIISIGLDDNGNAIGLSDKDVRKLQEDIPNKIIDGLHMYNIKVNLKEQAGRYYIDIEVPKSNEIISLNGKSYIRIGTTTHVMDFNSYKGSRLDLGARSWDAFTIDGVGIDDLDEDSFRLFKKLAYDNVANTPIPGFNRQKILEELNMIRAGKLTRAAILMFHRRPDEIIPGAFVRIGKMRTEGDVASKFELHGSLIKLSQDILDVLETRYLSYLVSYNGLVRVDTPPYPMLALRKALLNALMHCDWSAGEEIRIRVFDHKLEIANRAVLDPKWTLEDHKSSHWNAQIAEAFAKAGLVEKFGTGISKILKDCADTDSPVPAFEVTSSGHMMYVTFSASPLYLALEAYRNEVGDSESYIDYRKAVMMSDDIKAGLNKPDTNKQEESTESDTGRAESDTGKPEKHERYQPTFENCKKVFAAIKKDPAITYTMVAKTLGLSRSTVSRTVSILRDGGYIQAAEKNKKGTWKILKDYP